MKNAGLSALLAAVVTCGLAGTARADAEKPGVFTFAFQGLAVGSVAGLAAGYLVARDDGWQTSKDWKPLVYGIGIGALVGSGIGLTLGIVDVAQDTPGRTRHVLRDMLYGEGFGATAGAIAGGLTALSTKKPEHILLGSSIGVLSGAALGAVFGFFEGGHARAHGAPEPDRMSLSVVPVVEAGGKLAYLPALSGRY
jgi:hypothetical protein